MVKRTAVFILATLATVAASAQSSDDILGLWATEPTENGYSHVEITDNGDGYRGIIVWLSEPDYPADDPGGMAGQAKVDRENPEASLRSRPIIGLPILEGFSYSGSGQWKDGTIYDPESGKTYSCKMRLNRDGTLKVRGFIGFSLLGRTTVWRRPG